MMEIDRGVIPDDAMKKDLSSLVLQMKEYEALELKRDAVKSSLDRIEERMFSGVIKPSERMELEDVYDKVWRESYLSDWEGNIYP